MTIVDTRASSRSAKPATADALTELTAIDLITRYRIGNPSPADVIEAVLERIAQFEQRLNAFALLDADGARRAASESAARWCQGLQGAHEGAIRTR
jgi:aspartyl-tRNA(Asn)/glutamyl-tRNA(Gln) amidotransferase subunit A